MKYDEQFRLAAVRRYLRGGVVYRQLGKELNMSVSMLQRWVVWYQAHGTMGKTTPAPPYSAEFKLLVLRYMWDNKLSYGDTAVHFKIPDHNSLSKWSRLYKSGGAGALIPRAQGKSTRMTIPTTKPETEPVIGPLIDTGALTQKDLIGEINQLRMEVAYLKKLQALVQSQASKALVKKRK